MQFMGLKSDYTYIVQRLVMIMRAVMRLSWKPHYVFVKTLSTTLYRLCFVILKGYNEQRGG